MPGQRNGVAETVQRETETLRNQLGGLERARAAGSMTDAGVDVAQNNLLAVALARFQAIERSPADRLHNLLAPAIAVPEVSREAQAASLIEGMRAVGARLHGFADGSVEIHEAQGVADHLRRQAEGLCAEIYAIIRRDVVLIPAPSKPHHVSGVSA